VEYLALILIGLEWGKMNAKFQEKVIMDLLILNLNINLNRSIIRLRIKWSWIRKLDLQRRFRMAYSYFLIEGGVGEKLQNKDVTSKGESLNTR